MIDRDLVKHAGEFKGYLDNHKYEVSSEGVMFPKAGVTISGEYHISSPGYEDSIEPNLLPTEGLNHILMVALSSTAKLNTFYLALYSGNYTPTTARTAANFTATATELVSNTEGYSETTRRTWTPAAAASGQIDNVASKAAFTIATATSVTVRGAALLSDSVKGATSGVLVSAARFAQDRVQYTSDSFTLGYRVRLTST
jgi:hypothetical protein